jgi:hypothetical protein
MNRPDIANLYRRHTRRNHAALPEVDTLLTLADGETGADAERALADIGRFGLQADLLRFARDLAPESARLGVQLEQEFDARGATHRGDRRPARAAPRRSWLRAAGAVAAGLVVAASVWTWHQESPMPVAAAAPKADRIFASMDRGASANRGGDVIFHGAFAPDRIFVSKTGG